MVGRVVRAGLAQQPVAVRREDRTAQVRTEPRPVVAVDLGPVRARVVGAVLRDDRGLRLVVAAGLGRAEFLGARVDGRALDDAPRLLRQLIVEAWIVPVTAALHAVLPIPRVTGHAEGSPRRRRPAPRRRPRTARR